MILEEDDLSVLRERIKTLCKLHLVVSSIQQSFQYFTNGLYYQLYGMKYQLIDHGTGLYLSEENETPSTGRYQHLNNYS